jgi:hypothetical protein
MPAATAQVATARADRYLTQLCEHTGRMGLGLLHRAHRGGHGGGHGRGVTGGHGGGGQADGPPVPVRTERSGAEGLVDFGWGRCLLRAGPGGLALRAEAEDPERLRQVQDGIARRLERIGRRDALTVTWQQAAEQR